jgi:hypothetical protein
MQTRLPSEEWLHQFNQKMIAEDVLPEKRQYQAFKDWCFESGQSMSFGGEISRFISNWFATNTLSASAIGRSPSKTIFYHDMSFIELTIPLVFGEMEFAPVDMIRHVPDAVIKQIIESEAVQNDLFEHYQKAYNCFMACASTGKPKTENEWKLAVSAYKHLNAATAQLLESPPNPKALQDCRFAAEIALKAALTKLLGTPEDILRLKLGHHFNKILDYAASNQVALPVTLDDLAVFLDVSARYDVQNLERRVLWRGYSVALTCLDFAVSTIEGN